MSRRDRSGSAVQFDPTAPSAYRRRSRATSAPDLDFLPLSFVFIDILALFRRFFKTTNPVSRHGVEYPKSHHPQPLLIRGGSPESLSLDKEGPGAVDFCAGPLFS